MKLRGLSLKDKDGIKNSLHGWKFECSSYLVSSGNINLSVPCGVEVSSTWCCSVFNAWERKQEKTAWSHIQKVVKNLCIFKVSWSYGVPHLLGWELRGLLNERGCFSENLLQCTACMLGPLARTGQEAASSGAKHPPFWAKPPRNAPGNGSVLPRATGVTESPRGALRISWETHRPLSICWESAGLNPQILYIHWCYTWWRAAAALGRSLWDSLEEQTRQ